MTEIMYVQRADVTSSQKEPRITLPYFSKYEYTALLSARIQQLADGAAPLVPIQEFNRDDPRLLWNMAEREILERKLPYIIRRQLPNGKSEYWSVSELELAW
jgi:DNA-directed RNA polymerase I, II, and III subunit RPABC2